ncbi:MAG: DUF3048 domain-containing protein [Ilumatobacteraceae bacterium]
MIKSQRLLICLAVAGALTAASCSSGNSAATTVSSTSTTLAPSTTLATTTTTSIASDTTMSSTSTAPATPVMALTGEPITDQAKADRPALVVKIDNHPQARPQSGLNQADIVIEENVEHLTRFAAVFQSQDADPVGPIRSGRTQDVMMLGSLNKPLFAWSGGNGRVTAAIDGSDLVDVGPYGAGAAAYFRDQSIKRDSEHTLYSRTPTLFALAPAGAAPPLEQFHYLSSGAASTGTPAVGVTLAMDGVNVKWAFDAASGSYLRQQDGKPHMVAGGGQVSAANVVVLSVDYQASPADARSPEAQTLGTGPVTVFTAGKMITGTWTRSDRLQPFTLTDSSGEQIQLTPGRTWVELARVGKSTAVLS